MVRVVTEGLAGVLSGDSDRVNAARVGGGSRTGAAGIGTAMAVPDEAAAVTGSPGTQIAVRDATIAVRDVTIAVRDATSGTRGGRSEGSHGVMLCAAVPAVEARDPARTTGSFDRVPSVALSQSCPSTSRRSNWTRGRVENS